MAKKISSWVILVIILVLGVVGCGDKSETHKITINGGTYDPYTDAGENGWTYEPYTDSSENGKSTIDMKQDGNKLTFSGNVIHAVDNNSRGYAGFGVIPDEEKLAELKSADGFSFKCKGDGKYWSVQVILSTVTDYCHYEDVFQTSFTEETKTIFYDELLLPFWSTKYVEFDKSKITGIDFSQEDKGQFQFTIWDLQIGTNGGQRQRQIITITGIPRDYSIWMSPIGIHDKDEFKDDWDDWWDNETTRVAWNPGTNVKDGKVSFYLFVNGSLDEYWNGDGNGSGKEYWNGTGNYLLDFRLAGENGGWFIYTGGVPYNTSNKNAYTYPFTKNGKYTFNFNQFAVKEKWD